MYLDKVLKKIEKKTGLKSTTCPGLVTGPRLDVIPTGLLQLDLLLGGGVPFGRFMVLSGLEFSGKSTILYSILNQVLLNERFRKTAVLFFDHEGTLTLNYLSYMAGIPYSRYRSLFSTRVRYYEPETGDDTLYIIRALLKRLPRLVNENGKWFELYPSDLPKDLYKCIVEENKDNLDKQAYKEGILKVEIPSPYPTLVAFIDSLAAMFPASMDDNVESEKPGTKALMFSKWLSAIKPLLSSRQAVLIATNQIRERPMVMYGSPFYEPGGNAIKFYSDIRIKVNACSIPHARGTIETIGPNQYKYSKVETIKNKVFVPHLNTHIRLWISDDKGKQRGIDPVWDVMKYLSLTGQLHKKRGKDEYYISLPPFDQTVFTEKELASCIIEPINLYLLKKLEPPTEKVSTLVEYYKITNFLTQKQREYIETFSIQAKCKEQIESSEAFALLYKQEE